MPVTELEVKVALRKGHLPDAFTSSVYSASPYRGCGHGCLYCDGRAEKYYVEGDFVSDLGARLGLPALLGTELSTIRERDYAGRSSLLSLGSGVTDIYQPVEKDLGLTRACAEVLSRSGRPCLVITKSSLVLRDLDLWSRVAAGPGFVLLMTIAQDDDTLRKRFEPGASSLEERWRTLAAFRAAGAATGVLTMPLLPGISDDQRTLRSLYSRAADLGVDYLMPGGLTLRPGRQKDLYLDQIRALSPELLSSYQSWYGEDRPSGAPHWELQWDLREKTLPLAREFSLPFMLPHRIHSRFLPRYESLYLLLVQMEEIYGDRAQELPRLRQARSRLGDWLKGKRTDFRRHRTFEPTWIDGQFDRVLQPEGLEELLGNAKLGTWARQVLAGGVFDPISRRLSSTD